MEGSGSILQKSKAHCVQTVHRRMMCDTLQSSASLESRDLFEWKTQILNQFSCPDPTVPLILGLFHLRIHSFLPFLIPSLCLVTLGEKDHATLWFYMILPFLIQFSYILLFRIQSSFQ